MALALSWPWRWRWPALAAAPGTGPRQQVHDERRKTSSRPAIARSGGVIISEKILHDAEKCNHPHPDLAGDACTPERMLKFGRVDASFGSVQYSQKALAGHLHPPTK
jgi:hypothetical protein